MLVRLGRQREAAGCFREALTHAGSEPAILAREAGEL
jgi:hypothetical protein